MKAVILVGIGGAAGSVLRYLTSKFLCQYYPHTFPFGTFAVNMIGCFLIGLLYGSAVSSSSLNADLRLILITGFCGGFTTFSAFSSEGLALLQQQRFMIFFVYFAASICLGLAATFAGAWLHTNFSK